MDALEAELGAAESGMPHAPSAAQFRALERKIEQLEVRPVGGSGVTAVCVLSMTTMSPPPPSVPHAIDISLTWPVKPRMAINAPKPALARPRVIRLYRPGEHADDTALQHALQQHCDKRL